MKDKRRISCGQGAVGLAGGLRESESVRAQSMRELSWLSLIFCAVLDCLRRYRLQDVIQAA